MQIKKGIKFSWLLVCFINLCLFGNVYAQTDVLIFTKPDVIKIDPQSRKPEKLIPFDRPFVIEIESDKIVDDFVAVHAYKIPKYNHVFQKDESDYKIDMVVGKPQGKKLLISFPGIPSNTHFDFYIHRKFTGKNLNELKFFIDFLAKKNIELIPFSNDSLKKYEDLYYVFENKYKAQNDKYGLSVTALKYDSLVKAPHINAGGRVLEKWFLGNDIKSYYQNILNHDYTFTDSVFSSRTIVATNFYANKIDVAPIVYLDRIINTKYLGALASGRISLIYNHGDKKLNKYQFEKRIENLDTSLVNINRLLYKTENLILSTNSANPSLLGFRESLKGLKSKLIENKLILEKNWNKIVEKIHKEEGLRQLDWYVGSSEIADLQTMSGHSVIPQIGTGLMFTRNNANQIKAIPKLLLGINIFLKPIDKNIKRRYLQDKDLRHYLSFSVSLALGKFENYPDFDNLYNNTSLLVGPSLRLNRSMYLSAGPSFYRQKNVNPLIDKRSVSVGGYVSFLIDIDIAKQVSKVTDLMFK